MAQSAGLETPLLFACYNGSLGAVLSLLQVRLSPAGP